jgi:tryptamine 5-hydroxylase
LYHFDWALPSGMRADDVNLDEIFGLATRKKEPLFVVVRNSKEHEFKGGDTDVVV